MLRQLGDVIPRSFTVSLRRHPFYAHRYDSERYVGGAPSLWERMVRRPLLLARLAQRADGVLYLGRRGFLGGASRAPEFAFLRRHGIRICCYFVGTDIRSAVLLEQLEERTGVPNLGGRYRVINPMMLTTDWDAAQRRTAQEADRYADVIYTARVDQLGYLTRQTEPVQYFLPESAFRERERPSGRRTVVLHAPSNPLIKGTDLVRRAVDALLHEGRDFEYVELTGMPHHRVQEELDRADIVLNQFYALMPGVFGAEALAAGCAVMMSADGDVEPDLGPGANQAWCVTRHDQVLDHLRELLDDHARVAELGRRGREWCHRYMSERVAGARLNRVLDSVVAGTYTGPSGWDSDPGPASHSSSSS
jgi:hypothetical protein